MRLQERGYMDVVMNVNHTYLYWFSDDIEGAKAAASLETDSLETGGGKLSGVFRIKNEGETVFSPDVLFHSPDEPYDYFYGRMYVVLRPAGDPPSASLGGAKALYEVKAPIKPGEVFEFLVEHERVEPGDYTIELVCDGEYAPGDLGVSPIPVTVGR